MTLTPAQIDALSSYTNAQMAKLCQNAIATLISDPTASVTLPNGRSFSNQNLDSLQRLHLYYQDLANQDAANIAAADGGSAMLVIFQEGE